MGWPAELIYTIILMIIVIGIYIWSISSSFNKYKKAEEISGTVLMEIIPSKKEKLFRNSSLILCVILYFILRIKRGNMELSSLLILIALFSTSYLQYKNHLV